MNPEWIPNLIVLGLFYLALLSIRRRREAIRYTLRRLFFVGLAYLGVIKYLSQQGSAPLEAILGGVIAGLVADALVRKRSRYIPRRERRKAIARFEANTGKRYNSKKHDLHHEIAFSKGGSNTADKLRVTTQREPFQGSQVTLVGLVRVVRFEGDS